MDLISVIVPVYKVEKYLDRCVQSIVNQTYTNLEIILVDDGSPDNCPAMCDAWAKKDSRIKVIHKKNGGGAQARNIGLNHATGRYIGFVDSDDYILPEMYETLLNLLQMSNSDIAECDYSIVTSDATVEFESSADAITYYDTEHALLENIRDRICRQLVWNKLYSRQTLENIRFIEGKFIDDEFFTYRAIGNVKKLAITQQKFYCYRQQPNSAMHQSYSLKWLDAIEAKQSRLNYLYDNYPSLVPAAKVNLLFTCLYHGQMSLLHLNMDEQKIAFEKIHSALSQFPLTNDDKKSLPLKQRVWAILSLISFKTTCKLRNYLKIGI